MSIHRRTGREAVARMAESEDFVADLFGRLGFAVQREPRVAGLTVDLVVERDGLRSPVEVKYPPERLSLEELARVGARLRSICSTAPGYQSALIVVIGEITPAARDWLSKNFDLQVWDINVLRDRAKPFPDLELRLGQFAPRTSEDESASTSESDLASDLVARLADHEERDGLTPRQYEQLCQEVITFLFDPDLYGFESQVSTTEGADRYDFICRIKSGHSFWDTLRSDFRTRAILFECKNYSDKITADQIYSTERYLFSGALRTVCFLISRRGATEGCERAAQGALRESGKLLLLLSNSDLIEMIRLKVERNDPTSYLDEKIWKFITTLPR